MNKQGPDGIGWCDYTWNPIVGCSKISAGCANCYAEGVSRRFGLPWGAPVLKPERMGEPAKVKKPSRVFVCSMSDMGHAGVTTEWRWMITDAMRRAPWHTYIILTKRPGPWLRELPPVCWVGVTAENQAMADERIPILFQWAWPCAVKFVSAEPLLEKISFSQIRSGLPDDMGHHQEPYLAFVIAGPETGPKARPCDPEWIEALSRESPCFFDKRAGDGRRREWPTKQRKERT